MATITSHLDYEIRHNTKDPIPPDTERQGLSQEDEHRCVQHEYYQRNKLSGFSLAILREIGCFGIENAIPSDLGTQNFHPLYRKENWIASNFEEIGHGFPGVWDLWDNPQVKEAVLPCLYLASEFLSLCITDSYWYDGLLLGQWKVEPPNSSEDGCPPNSTFYNMSSFSNSDPRDFNQPGRLIDRKGFSEVGNGVQFRIATGMLSSGRLAYGYFEPNYHGTDADGHIYQGGTVTIASQMLLSLLQDDLTTSERLVQQLYVASTLVHETMHATGHFAQLIHAPPRPLVLPHQIHAAEPFFENEAMCELGNSWENSFYGGRMGQIHIHDATNFHLPALGTVLHTWPGFLNYQDGRYDDAANDGIRYRHPGDFQLGCQRTLYPVPSLFIEDIQQTDFWRVHVHRFGILAMAPPISYGAVTTKTSNLRADGLMSENWDYSPVLPPPNHSDYQQWQNTRRETIRAEAMKTVLRKNQIWREMELYRRRHNMMMYVQDAVFTNKGDVQDSCIMQIKRMQAAGERCDDLLQLMRTSQIDHCRIQAFFLSSRLSHHASRDERLRWAAMAVMEATIRRTYPWVQIDWDVFLREAQMEVQLIEQEIAIYGP